MEELYKKRLMVFCGEDDIENNLEDGKVFGMGDVDDDQSHLEWMLEYAKEHYSDVPVFDKINKQSPIAVIIYIYTHILGNALFLNWSINDTKEGVVCLPSNISDKQRKSLNEVLSLVDECEVCYNYAVNQGGQVIWDDEYGLNSNELLDIIGKTKAINKKI